MSKREHTTYYCDKCGKQLTGFRNSLTIETKLSGGYRSWSKFLVEIEYRAGFDNNIERQSNADLCKECAVFLLQDALNRVINGERASAGVEGSDEKGWEGVSDEHIRYRT